MLSNLNHIVSYLKSLNNNKKPCFPCNINFILVASHFFTEKAKLTPRCWKCVLDLDKLNGKCVSFTLKSSPGTKIKLLKGRWNLPTPSLPPPHLPAARLPGLGRFSSRDFVCQVQQCPFSSRLVSPPFGASPQFNLHGNLPSCKHLLKQFVNPDCVLQATSHLRS